MILQVRANVLTNYSFLVIKNRGSQEKKRIKIWFFVQLNKWKKDNCKKVLKNNRDIL
jgi:hypothetical protein